MWQHSSCYMRVVCYSWLPQVWVKTTPSAASSAGVPLLTQTEKAATRTRKQKEDLPLKYWWDNWLFCCQKEGPGGKRRLFLLLLYAFVLFLVRTGFKGGEIHIALLKPTAPATPETLNRHKRARFQRVWLIQLSLPQHDTQALSVWLMTWI